MRVGVAPSVRDGREKAVVQVVFHRDIQRLAGLTQLSGRRAAVFVKRLAVIAHEQIRVRQIRKQPRFQPLHRRIHIAAELRRRADIAEIHAVFVVVVEVVAQNQVIQMVFRPHVRQPIHVIREIFALKAGQNVNLILVLRRQRADAVQIPRHLIHAHADAGVRVSVLIRPRHMIRKAQLVKPLFNRRQHIILVRTRRVAAARRMRMVIRLHG